MSSTLCDPRISWRGCPQHWHNDLQVYFYGLAIFAASSLVTTIGYTIITFTRQGFAFSLPRQLSIFQILSSSLIFAYSLVMADRDGNWTRDFWIELLFGLPLVLTTYTFACVILFVNYLYRIQLDELVLSLQNIKRTYLQVYVISLLFGAPLILSTIASAILLHYKPQYSRWTYLIPMVTIVIIGTLILIGIFASYRIMKRAFARVKRLIICVITLIVSLSIWIVAIVIHLCLYNILLENSSPFPWIAVMSVQQICAGVCMVTLSKVLSSETFTDKGIQALQSKIMIKMKTSKSSTLSAPQVSAEVVDIAAGSGNSGSASSDGVTNTNSGENCEAGICVRMDIKLARNLAEPFFWRNPPKSFKELFTFPHPVNEVDARIKSVMISGWAICILLLHAYHDNITVWFYIPLVYGFIARVLCGPRFDPHTWISVYFLSPHFEPVYVPGPPKRFSQLCGVIFSGTSVILYLTGEKVAAMWFMGLLLTVTITQGLGGICVGCFFFYLLNLAKVTSEEVRKQSNVEFKVVNGEEEKNPAGSGSRTVTRRDTVVSL